LDNLKQIDNILKKAVADMPNSGHNLSSDWDAIEKKLKQRKRRIVFMWSFLALFISSSLILFRLNSNTSADKLTNKGIANQKNLTPFSIKKSIENENKKSRNKSLSYNKEILNPIRSVTINSQNTITQKNTKTKKEFAVTLHSKTINIFNQKINQPKKIVFVKIPQLKNLVSSNKTAYKKGWEYGISFTPSISNKIVQENSNLSGLINRNYNLFIGNQEKSTFANNFGFNFSYHFGPKLFFASGLYLTQRAEYINYNYTITEFPIVTNGEITDYAPLNPLAYVDINHAGSNLYHFIEIPVNLGFKQPISTNFEIRSQFGVSLLSLTNIDGKKGNFLNLQLEDLSDLKFNTYNIATTVKSGIYFNKKRFNIGLEPSYSININSLNDSESSAFKTRPYSYGINLTTNIKIFKQ
jgi:hypothetical protein